MRAFTFYEHWFDALTSLDVDDQLSAYWAVMKYGLYGDEPEDGTIEAAIIALIRDDIDATRREIEYPERDSK